MSDSEEIGYKVQKDTMHGKNEAGNCEETEQQPLDLIRIGELVQSEVYEYYTKNDLNQPDHKSQSRQITSAKDMLEDNKPQP